MLVLTRRPGESIIIGEGIKLTVVSVGPGRVKIGIEAPQNVRIDREEIHTRIQQEAGVLDAVTADALQSQSDQNTMINSGSETGIFHNRIADKLPSETQTPTANPTPTAPLSRISKFRLPRKPR